MGKNRQQPPMQKRVSPNKPEMRAAAAKKFAMGVVRQLEVGCHTRISPLPGTAASPE
jgi:hypothetical protein